MARHPMEQDTVTKIYNLVDKFDDNFSIASETENALINGFGGNDVIYGGKGSDTVQGGAGNDSIYGGANGTDLLVGGEGHDRIAATSSMHGGSSTLVGGVGDDTYVVGAAQTFTITELAGEGYDTVELGINSRGNHYTLADNVERLVVTKVHFVAEGSIYDDYQPPSGVSGNALGNAMYMNSALSVSMWGKGGNDSMFGGSDVDYLDGGSGHDHLSGGGGDDSLNGDSDGAVGHDTLDGGVGADDMEGFAGNDTYYVDNAGDKVTERAGEGTDTVITTLTSYALGANVENLTMQGLAGTTALGNALANVIVGGIGGDVIQGREGNDKIHGGFGNDWVHAGAHNDLVNGDAGDDYLYGEGGHDTLNGGTGHDRLDGGAANDVLNGGAGNDELRGGTGNDILKGEDGNDVLRGDAGLDHMWGGGGADKFVFAAVIESPFGGALDGIWDFQKGVDRIDVSLIDANTTLGGGQSFSFSASAPMFIDAGTLWLQEQGGSTTVYADVNGDGGADIGVYVYGVTGLTASDFVL